MSLLKVLENLPPLTPKDVETARDLVADGKTCSVENHGCTHAACCSPHINDMASVSIDVAIAQAKKRGEKADPNTIVLSALSTGIHIGYALALVHLGLHKEGSVQ